MKVAFVVHRFGSDFAGGAEHLALQFAQQMKSHWDITVLTTCAHDYRTWDNHFPAGPQQVDGISTIRFPVDRPRDFAAFSASAARKEHRAYALSDRDEDDYFVAQGPNTPQLIDFIEHHADEFDAFVFFTYLYYPTVFGIPKVGRKAYLVSTAHEESPFYLNRFRDIFPKVRGLIFLTQAERDLVNRTHEIPASVRQIDAGIGVEPLPDNPAASAKMREKFSAFLNSPFFLYVGRATSTKRCQDLVTAFVGLRGDLQVDAKLVFAGMVDIDLPDRDDIFDVGFVSEEEKAFLIRQSRALVQPSALESLSIVVLEAWALGCPVIVNGQSDVLRRHCDLSGAGLYYFSHSMCKGLLAWACQHERDIEALGHGGCHYIFDRYRWEVIQKRLLQGVTP